MSGDKMLPYGRQLIDDDDVAAVVAQLKGDWLTQGPTVGRFEEALCGITGARYAVAVANGTAALHLACLAAEVSPGDAALVPDVTFVATANAVRYCGARPVLVDVEPDTGLVSLDGLDEHLRLATRRGSAPRAVLPVSLAGATADLERIRVMADTVGARVIEDAAHSLGATYEASGGTTLSASCAHTDMAILSFHPVKHLTTGEGGAITTNDSRLNQLLRDLRTHGITKDPARLEENDGPWYQEQWTLGFNYRLTDIQSALGVSQSRKFPGFLERRRQLAAMYDTALEPMEAHLHPLRVPDGVASAYHLYVVQLTRRGGESLTELAARRKALYLWLREQNIASQVHYVPVHRQPSFRRAGLCDGVFPGADAYYAGCLSLPMFPAMMDEDVVRTVTALQGFFEPRG